MLESFRGPLAFILLLGVLVFVHELGHFLVAKACGVKVLRFAFGFGPKLLSFRKGETEYAICLLPLGGYVLMAGAQGPDELPPEEAHRSLLAKSPWQRALIAAAGPAFSLAFPVLVYFFVFLGTHQVPSSRVGSVEPGLPAAAAGLQPGDRVQVVDGQPVRTFEDLQNALRSADGRKLPITFLRGDQTHVAQLTPAQVSDTRNPMEATSRGVIGITSLNRTAVLGVPPGSPAAAAGLRTFDKVLQVNGQPVASEPELLQRLATAQGRLTVEVERTEPAALRALVSGGQQGAEATPPPTRRHTVELERQPGEGLAALGAERADLYVGAVEPGSPAARAGLQPGDRLLALDGRPLESMTLFQSALKLRKDAPLQLSWRDGAGETREATLAQALRESKNDFGHRVKGLDLGLRFPQLLDTVSPPELVTLHYGVGEALAKSLEVVPRVIAQTARGIGMLFTKKDALGDVGGVILIYQVASKTAEYGVGPFVELMGLISVNLGLVNLIPIPILDGFAILVALWEGVRRRPVTMRAREVANYVGLAVIIALFVLVMFNDINRSRDVQRDVQHQAPAGESPAP